MPDTNQNRAPEHRESQAQPGARSPAPRTKRKRRRRPLWLTIIIRVLQVIGTLILIGIVTGCFMLCYAAVYVRTAVIPRAFLNLSDYTMKENSVIYYRDKNTGELVELQTLRGKENRELVEYEDIPEDLIHAFIAVEDKTYWEHHGVNWKRTAAGLLYMLTGRNIQGGSTITQQVIKNATQYKDVTVTRKILEIFTALELDSNYRKEEILTFYFNKIYMGNGCDGIQAASRFYFGKNVSDLTLAECASLAGITNNPSLYAPYGVVDVVRYRCTNPGCKMYSLSKDKPCEYCGGHSFDSGSVWTNREFNKARQELILNLMADPEISPNGAYITEAERDAAIAQPLVFKRDLQAGGESGEPSTQKSPSRYSWYVEAAINEAIAALQAETGLTWDMCEQRVFSGGLSIIVAYDPEVQAAVDAIYNDPESLTKVSKTGQKLMSNISVVDNSTGYVVAMGSTREKKVDRGSVWPVSSVRQPGSSIKPLSVYAPALDMGVISPATVFDDNPQLLNGKVWPTNAPNEYRGLTTVLDGVTRSVNTVALGVVDTITPQASYDFMVDKFGFTSLAAYYVKPNGEVASDIDRSPMSMGGLTWGVSTFEMAAAYATFPRGGAFTKATTVLEIWDANKTVIVDNAPKPEYPIKASTAYYMNSMLTNVVTSGTGKGARISGQTVAGKTGTTNSRYDLWFCGYTSYYTAAVWTGYPDRNEVIEYTGTSPAVTMWQKVMSILHEEKENQAFEVPGNLNSYDICRDCGKRATPDCAADTRGSRVQSFRLFAEDAPSGYCQCHRAVRICTECPILNNKGEATGSYRLAGEFCPEESVKTVTMVDYQRVLASDSVWVWDTYALLGIYDSLPAEGRYCDVHTYTSYDPPPDSSDNPWNSDWPDPPNPPDPPDPSFNPLPSFDPNPFVSIDPNGGPPYIPAGGWGDTE